MKRARADFRSIPFILLIAAVLIVSACTLSACDFLGWSQAVKSIDLGIEGNFSYSAEDDVYTVSVDEEFTLVATLNANASADTAVKWYVSVDGKAEYIGGGAGVLKLVRTLDEVDGKIYEFYAVANSKQSESVRVCARYADLSSLAIESASHSVVGGVVRQKTDSAVDVTLVAEWNANISPDSVVTVEWFANADGAWQPVAAREDGSFVYSHVGGEAEIGIKAVATCDGITVESQIVLSYVDAYEQVMSVKVEMESNVMSEAEQYVVYSDDGSSTEIVLSASTLPESTDLSSPVTWEIRNVYGTDNPDSHGRTLTFRPAAGENFVTATVDGVESLHLVVICLAQSEYAARKDVITDTFVWRGGVHNFYVSDSEDLAAVISYAVSQHKTEAEGTYDWYLAPSAWTNTGSFVENTTQTFANVFNQATEEIDESGNFGFSYTTRQLTIKAEDTNFGIPSGAAPLTYGVTQQQSVVTYHTDGIQRRKSLYIDTVADTALATDSNMLFRLVEWGYKPEFDSSAQSRSAQRIYEKARTILLSIIDYSMSDLDKVRAIYEWIIVNVDYDYAAAEADQTDITTLGYNAFYLEGVFNDGRAVCDGKSKAFSLMCGMEGIDTVRVLGCVYNNPENLHAWNKVLLDVDGDLDKEWFVVDTTWGDVQQVTGSEFLIEERLSYDYLLLNDGEISSTHTANSACNPPAVNTCNVYAATNVDEGVSLYIDSRADLQALVDFLDDNLDVWVNVKVATSYAATRLALETELRTVCGLKPFEFSRSMSSGGYWVKRY